VTEPIVVSEDRATLIAVPAHSEYVLSYWLDYDHPQMSQAFSIAAEGDALLSEVAPARTFCLEEEAEALKKEGIGKGANYQNVLVVGKTGVIDNRLRFPDEFARHKILDIVGDLLLVGARIRGHVIGHRSGHAHNFQLAKKMVSEMAKRNREEEDLSSKYLDIRQIQEILPHRYPMLLVDRVIEVDGERRAVGIKNVTINEEFFQGHFPGQPIMPGVLQIEAMAQLAGVLLLRRLKGTSKLAVLLSIDKVKLRRPVVPGDQLRLEAEAVKVKSRTGQVNTRALVEGVVAAEAQIKFMLVDRDSYAKSPSEVVPETE
jgi:UDP-3-O-[3-hydroxymyristoyl] N-acetylglucosamine deacetylase/3-hydroxyacyl-[acyl-carrier-protein] dehydratase